MARYSNKCSDKFIVHLLQMAEKEKCTKKKLLDHLMGTNHFKDLSVNGS